MIKDGALHIWTDQESVFSFIENTPEHISKKSKEEARSDGHNPGEQG